MKDRPSRHLSIVTPRNSLSTCIFMLGLIGSNLHIANATDFCVSPRAGFWQAGASMRLIDGLGAASLFSGSMQYWQSCPGYGWEFPSLTTNNVSANVNVTVYYYQSDNPNGYCGLRTPISSSQSIIEIWGTHSGGFPCQSPTFVLAHELGHVYGLLDSYCSGYLMSTQSTSWTQFSECSTVDTLWDGPTPYDNNGPTSPIILDLDRNGFRLSGLEDSVYFDIDADGVSDRISWTREGAKEGFLALDRNRNGLIDDGLELFGNSTILATGLRASNGYIALGEFDAPELGGNGDHLIDSNDAVFVELLIWIDDNHNGWSEWTELRSAPASGIISISLDYDMNRRRDQYGNQLTFSGEAWLRSEGEEKPIKVATADVFFVREGQP